MVGHVRRAHGAEEDGVQGSKPFRAIERHERALASVALAAPIEPFHLEPEVADPLSQSLEDLKSCPDDLNPDPVAGNRGDMVGLHFRSPYQMKLAANSFRR